MSKAAELAKAGETLTNQPSGRKNLVTNGAMQVAQRGTDVAWASNGYLALDRFNTANNSTAGRFSMKQTADGPSGFANCLEIDVTTADTSIASAEHMIVQYKFEGQDLQQLKKGTSDAESFTISFYVKGNGNATYMCELFDRDNTRLTRQQFAVTSSWNRVELTFVGDTTGAFDDDNAHSFDIQFWLHAGSDFTSGTYTSNTWSGQTNTNRAVGISSIYSSTDNYIRITGLQMEIGSQATNFEHRSFGEELALCQRYFFIGCSSTDAHTGGMANGSFRTTSNAQILQQHPVAMRANPTATLRASGSVVIHDTNDGNNINVTAIDSVVFQSIKSTLIGLTLASASGVVGEGCWTYSATSTPGITFDAEL